MIFRRLKWPFINEVLWHFREQRLPRWLQEVEIGRSAALFGRSAALCGRSAALCGRSVALYGRSAELFGRMSKKVRRFLHASLTHLYRNKIGHHGHHGHQACQNIFDFDFEA